MITLHWPKCVLFLNRVRAPTHPQLPDTCPCLPPRACSSACLILWVGLENWSNWKLVTFFEWAHTSASLKWSPSCSLHLFTSQDRELEVLNDLHSHRIWLLLERLYYKYEDLAASRVGRYKGKNQRTEETLLLLRVFKTVSGRARVNFVYS